MDALVHRRLTVATCWAVARISSLDTIQCFEESFGLTEEFREWILGLDQHPELLEDTVLMAPAISTLQQLQRTAAPHPLDPGSNVDLLEI
jgi:hypothetical protein